MSTGLFDENVNVYLIFQTNSIWVNVIFLLAKISKSHTTSVVISYEYADHTHSEYAEYTFLQITTSIT